MPPHVTERQCLSLPWSLHRIKPFCFATSPRTKHGDPTVHLSRAVHSQCSTERQQERSYLLQDAAQQGALGTQLGSSGASDHSCALCGPTSAAHGVGVLEAWWRRCHAQQDSKTPAPLPGYRMSSGSALLLVLLVLVLCGCRSDLDLPFTCSVCRNSKQVGRSAACTNIIYRNIYCELDCSWYCSVHRSTCA